MAERCDSLDPYGTLRCTRAVHEDDQCQYGGIAWKRGHKVNSPAAKALWEAAEAWRYEGRAVMFNKAGDDLMPHQRVEKWLRDRAAVLS